MWSFLQLPNPETNHPFQKVLSGNRYMSCYRFGGWKKNKTTTTTPQKKEEEKRNLKCWIRNNTISLLTFSEYRNFSQTTPSTILFIMRAQHFSQVKDPHGSIQALRGLVFKWFPLYTTCWKDQACLQCTTMKKYIHLQNFKDNLKQSQLKHILKSDNIRLQNVTTMLISRSCTHQKCIKSFKVIPQRKNILMVCLHKRLRIKPPSSKHQGKWRNYEWAFTGFFPDQEFKNVSI